jgi:radical SAM pair-associated protein
MYEIDDGKLKMDVSLLLYPHEVITATLYLFTGRCFVSSKLKDNETVEISFEPKEGMRDSLPELANAFSNALIDQQLRFQLNREYGAIRDMIVQRAFAPITKISQS